MLGHTFLIANFGVLPFWLLLIALPQNVWTKRIVHSSLGPILYGVLYVVLLLLPNDASPDGNFATLEGVGLLFREPEIVFLGWVHFIVFDLFVGSWIVRDAHRRGIRHLLVIPCLVLTLMVGPSGLLAYMLLRGALTKRWLLDEEVETSAQGASA